MTTTKATQQWPSTLSHTPPLLLLVLFLQYACVCMADDEAVNEQAEQLRLAREQAKPWLMKSLTVFGTNLFFSPATFLVGLLVVVNVYYIFFHGRNATCHAHHILLKEANDANKKMLQSMKDDIGTDVIKFGDYAKKYSQCPSKSNKGDLGTFPRGAMVAPFDQVCFDSTSPVGTVLGPIRTPFGWHLIFIKSRKLS